MTLYQLINVSETASCGSITQAAKRLHISQPALSESIRDLEKEFSITIFIRSRKGVILTQEGSDFISHARSVLSSIERLNNTFLKSENASLLKIATTKIPVVQKTFLDFCSHNNFMEYRCSSSYLESLSYGVLENIFSGEADLGFILISAIGEHSWKTSMDDRSMDYHYLFSSSPCVILRKSHPLRDFKVLNESDLNGFPVIYTYEPQKSFPNNNTAYYSYNLKKYNNVIYVYNQGTAFDFISASDAVCIMSCTKGLQYVRPELASVPFNTASIWNAYWVKQKNHILTMHEQCFLDMLDKNILNC